MEPDAAPVAVMDIEEALCEVAGVKAARVVTSSDHVITEVHVLALPTKSPKQVVRDIESAVMARFGIPLDHRKISIALLADTSLPEEEVHPAEGQRARIHAIQQNVEDLIASANVVLELEGELYEGSASGPATQTGRMRIVAEATLEAIVAYTHGLIRFALEDVDMVKLGRERAAVSCVQLMSQLGEQAFCGSALVRQSEQDSIVRATLDAINRRLTFLKTS
ncbi:MAG: hypothetical protein FDZ70_01680 [Actinobacteria bacterium]|nr:MAG: hypothetical protein FDZ70_01680 [Actinomycetota bacterium]